MNTNAIVLCALAAAMGIAGQVASGSQYTGSTASHLHVAACEDPAKSDSPWHITNLYDCRTSTLFIPHQLRTGTAWDGVKITPEAQADACSFPTGHGWAISVRRACAGAAIEITAIALNDRNELESIEFNTWADAMPHRLYRYTANVGMTDVWPL